MSKTIQKPYEFSIKDLDKILGAEDADDWNLKIAHAAQKRLLEYLDNKYHQHLPRRFMQPMYVPAEEWDALLRDFGINGAEQEG